ncbi:hypothetical protein EBR21_04825 [bacterium]|nr:hypothetical protein [bacterium]
MQPYQQLKQTLFISDAVSNQSTPHDSLRQGSVNELQCAMLKIVSFVLLTTLASCGERNANIPGSELVKPNVTTNQGDDELGLSGLGDHSCRLTYQLVKKVTEMSSAQEFYEMDSGDLVSNKPTRDSGFGEGCLSFCSSEYQLLSNRYGANRVLVKGCNFIRQVSTASVKGWVEGYANGVVSGWACKYGQESSVPVELFLGGSAGVGTFVARFSAKLPAKDSTDKASLASQCGTRGGMHRFEYTLSQALIEKNAGMAIFVHAINVTDSTKNFLIGNSGALRLPSPVISVTATATPTSVPTASAAFTLDEAKQFCVACHSSTSSVAGASVWNKADGGEADWKAFAMKAKFAVESDLMPIPPMSASNKSRFLAFLNSLQMPTQPTPTPTAPSVPTPVVGTPTPTTNSKLVEFNSTYKALIQNSCVNGCHMHVYQLGNEVTFDRVVVAGPMMKSRLDNGSMPRPPVMIAPNVRQALSSWLGSLP